MRTISLFLLFFWASKSLSQTDSSIVKNGFSVFGGFGTGGNGIKQGFAKGLALRAHFGVHTIDGYLASTAKNEAGYTPGHDLKLTYDAFNCGISYGVGLYEKNFSYAALVGIGYSNTAVITIDPASTQIFVTKNYFGMCGVLGLQAGIRVGFIGLGTKFYYNVLDGPSNYTLLFGIEFNMNKG